MKFLKAYNLKLKASNKDGQSLLEIIVAVAVGSIIVGSVVVSIVGVLRGNIQSKQTQYAAGIVGEYFTVLNGITENDWHDIYDLSKGSSNKYMLRLGSSSVDIIQGEEGLIGDDVTNGLVGYWKFDEATGTIVYDFSELQNNGTLSE